MGEIRARSSEEIDNRKKEILDVTEDLFMNMEYQDITLAIIAEKTSISRPSMYNYYKTKEEVFLDLSKREYLSFNESIKTAFSRKVSREKFCQKMADTIWKHQPFLKILSLHSSVIEEKCGKDLMYDYKKSVQPLFETFSNILAKQFPDSSEESRELFKVHFFMYTYSLYPAGHIPKEQAEVMRELKPFGDLPDMKQVFYDALMRFSSSL